MLTFLSAFLSLSTTDSATLRQHWMEAVALSERHVVSGDNRTKVVQMQQKHHLKKIRIHSFSERITHLLKNGDHLSDLGCVLHDLRRNQSK